MSGRLTVVGALRDPALLGGLPAFRNLETWRLWLIFLKAWDGLPLDDDEERIFCKYTGRTRYAPPVGGYRRGIVISGRQSGKTQMAGAVTDTEALGATREPDGADLYAIVVAQDQRGGTRVLFRYATAPFEIVPVLRESVIGRTAETLSLSNGSTLAVYPCRPAAVRGLRASIVVLDELAFYTSSENYPTDVEMLRAAQPCLATTNGRLLILSSPDGQTGALWNLYRKHYGRDDSPWLCWVASAAEMNPTLSADYLRAMAEDDPEAYRSEVLGEFRAGVSTLLDPAAIDQGVAAGVRERAPVVGTRYVAFCDPSGGRRDKFTVGVAHRDGDRAVLDLIRWWSPPFNPSSVVAEIADLLRRYGCGRVVSDRYAGEFVAEQFRAAGIEHRASDADRSTIYLDVLSLINSGRVVLLDVPDLLRELRGLERRRGASGRDRVDHRAGAHDDIANSCCGALRLVSRPVVEPRITVFDLDD